MGTKRSCVNCKHEDASKTLSSRDPNYPGRRGETDIAIWCNKLNRYIGGDDRQAVRLKPDGRTYETNEWCGNFIHY